MKTKSFLSSLALCTCLAGSALATPHFKDEKLSILNSLSFHASDAIVEVRGDKANPLMKDAVYTSFAEIDAAINAALRGAGQEEICASGLLELNLVVVGSDGVLAEDDNFVVSVKQGADTVDEDVGLDSDPSLVSILSIDGFSARSGLSFAIGTESGAEVPADQGLKLGLMIFCPSPPPPPPPTFFPGNLAALSEDDNFHSEDELWFKERGEIADPDRPDVSTSIVSVVENLLTKPIQTLGFSGCASDVMEIKLVVVGSSGVLPGRAYFSVELMDGNEVIDSSRGDPSDLVVPMTLQIPNHSAIGHRIKARFRIETPASMSPGEGVKVGLTIGCGPMRPPRFAPENLAVLGDDMNFHPSDEALFVERTNEGDAEKPEMYYSDFKSVNTVMTAAIRGTDMSNCASGTMEIKVVVVGSAYALAKGNNFSVTIMDDGAEIDRKTGSRSSLAMPMTLEIPDFASHQALRFVASTTRNVGILAAEGLKLGLTAACKSS